MGKWSAEDPVLSNKRYHDRRGLFMKYGIVEGLEIAGLVKVVGMAIEDGYEPIGGPFPLPERMCWYGQAVIKRGLDPVSGLANEGRELGRNIRGLANSETVEVTESTETIVETVKAVETLQPPPSKRKK